MDEKPLSCELTPREKKVARALLLYWETKRGKSSLGVISRVVSQCSTSLRAKMNVSDTRQAIYKARSLGLID